MNLIIIRQIERSEGESYAIGNIEIKQYYYVWGNCASSYGNCKSYSWKIFPL